MTIIRVKAQEIKTSMLFNLVTANNTTLSCFFFLLLIINLWILIAAIIAQIFNPIAELVIHLGIPSKDTKAEIKMHLVTVEAKLRKYM